MGNGTKWNVNSHFWNILFHERQHLWVTLEWRTVGPTRECRWWEVNRPGAASWPLRAQGGFSPSAAPEDSQLVRHEGGCLSPWRVETHPGQNVEAILQPGTLLHHFLQALRSRVLGVLQVLDLCRSSLDLKLLKAKQSRGGLCCTTIFQFNLHKYTWFIINCGQYDADRLNRNESEMERWNGQNCAKTTKTGKSTSRKDYNQWDTSFVEHLLFSRWMCRLKRRFTCCWSSSVYSLIRSPISELFWPLSQLFPFLLRVAEVKQKRVHSAPFHNRWNYTN